MAGPLLIAVGTVAALAWAYLLIAHGGFWHVGSILSVPGGGAPDVRVAAIIPARNEAATVGSCLKSLLEQRGAERLSIFLVDDGSSDGTAEVARKAAADGALTIINGKPLPTGWSGKLWAVKQGVNAVRSLAPDYFLLTDADIVHQPETLPTLVEIARSGRYDLVSFMVKLGCATVAEKLLIPAFVFFFFKLYPPSWIANPRRTTAGAAGGCILLTPEALARAGGIEAIRAEIIDDCALARAVKRSGGRIWLGLTETSHSIRSYGSFAEIGRMIARSAFNQLRHSVLLLATSVLGLAVLYLVPWALLFSGRPLPIVLGAFAWLLMTAAYLPMVRFYGLNVLWALTLPLAALFYMGATFVSAIHYWTGRGGQWKGRAQDVAASR
jgi:hopene-associated glycosyltransferase HpnB